MENRVLRFFIAAGLVGLMIVSSSTALCKDKQVPPKHAELATAQANAKVCQELPFSNTEDFDDAERGWIATIPDALIYGDDGQVAWTLKGYEFLSAPKVPLTVNPSLWRQAVLNMNNGLFRITEGEGPGIYQVRGFDLASMMIIEGQSGIILIDPMTSVETARAALDLYYAKVPGPGGVKRPVKAVIYTHSHIDHYGGVRGVVSQSDVDNGVKIIAPDGFLEEAVSENILAGSAMGRRALYQYGSLLQKGTRGQVDSGLGKGKSNGAATLIAPNIVIKQSLEKIDYIDGVEMWFQLALDTEAPAEMLIWFPQYKALCAAEDMNHLNHNLYTLRGAQVRDARKWWKAINQALDQFGDKAEVMFFAHTWPVWSNDKIVKFMKKQRDLYKYVHDQSLQLINKGYTMFEVAENLKLPQSLAQEWFNRDYYGTVNHNAKAVYQKYIGWYDGNPANLHALPPEEAAKRYLEYMGSSQAVIARARQAFKAGDYRWVAQIMNHVVFAEPNNRAARELGADALEQLGYQAESGIWRNHYLTGAFELRNGVPPLPASGSNVDQLKAMTMDLYFDYLGIQLNAPKADGKFIVLNWNITDDKNGKYVLSLENSALTYIGPDKESSTADATVKMTRATFDAINTEGLTWQAAIKSGQVVIEGNPNKLFELLGLLDAKYDPRFNIVTP